MTTDGVTRRASDPRSIRTVKALRAALRGALDARSLEDVSVSGICRLAGIQRTTFYTHYASVPELLTEMLTSEIERLLTLPDPVEVAGRSTAELSAEFQRTLAAAFEVVTADRHLYRVGFDSSASGLMRRALAAMFLRRVEGAIATWRLHGQALEVDTAVAAPFAAGGLAASVESWALSDETDSERWAATVRDQMAPWWPRG